MLKLKRNRNLKILVLFALIVFLIFSFGSVLANNIKSENVLIEEGETLEKTTFISGDNVKIDGNINASSFITADDVEVNGNIDGDLFILSGSATINGRVNGSLFLFSEDVLVNGNIENNIYSAASDIRIESENGGSSFLAGERVHIEDQAIVEKDVFIGASEIYHDGTINGDLSSSSGSLSINGRIGGDLEYRSQDRANFSNDAVIEGQTSRKQMERDFSPVNFALSVLVFILLSVLTALVVWLFVRLIKPHLWQDISENIAISPLKTLAFGALALVLIPIACVVLIFTVIGAPLGLILLALYTISLYVANIIFSSFIGFWFKRKFNWSGFQAFWIFLLSLILISILVMIPIVGWIFGLVIGAFGLGSIVLSIRK